MWVLRIKGFGPNRTAAEKEIDLSRSPSPAILALGIGGVRTGQYVIERRHVNQMTMQDRKPAYRVPAIAEVVSLPWNGFTVASTFSGCGGSCTGYRMEGFRVVWANEFVPAAQASYKANSSVECVLDCRDIKVVTPADVLSAAGLKVGDLDLFDGSPPCPAFSTAGKREKNWGKQRHYEHGASQTNETLFDEYIRLLRGLMPRTFVAENVSGLIKGKAKGFFLEILAGLKASGYRVECRLLDAKWLGVPQTRQRVIFIGVRDDLRLAPAFPDPLPYFYTVRDALPELWSVEPCSTDQHPSFVQGEVIDKPCPTNLSLVRADDAAPSPTITASGGGTGTAGVTHPTERRKFTIGEVKRICGFPDDYVLLGSYAQQWERLGNSVPPVMMAAIARAIRDRVLIPNRKAGGP